MAELGIYLNIYVWKSQVNFLSVILQKLSLQGWFFVLETDLSQTSHRAPGILVSTVPELGLYMHNTCFHVDTEDQTQILMLA